MIRCYTIDKLPREYYGETYDIFSFEVFNDRPVHLYFGNSNGTIIKLEDIWELHDYYNRGCELLPMAPDFFKISRKERRERERRREISEINLKHHLELFRLFLESITVDRANAKFPVYCDIHYAEQKFHIYINTETTKN